MNLLRIDPIKWIDDLLCSARNGPGVRIEWLAVGPDGAAVENFLRERGIRVWGRKYAFGGPGDTYAVTVRAAQAEIADGLLRGWGVPVVSPQLSRPVTFGRVWGVPAPAQGLGGLLVQGATGGPRRHERARPVQRVRRRARPRRGIP